MKIKFFDCVEMKRQAQAKLLLEYESRKEEFESRVLLFICKGTDNAPIRTPFH